MPRQRLAYIPEHFPRFDIDYAFLIKILIVIYETMLVNKTARA